MRTQIIKTYKPSEIDGRVRLVEIDIHIEGISDSKDIDRSIEQLRDLQRDILKEEMLQLIEWTNKDIENLLVKVHVGKVIGVARIPRYKPNSQEANSDVISVEKKQNGHKLKKDSLSQVCCDLCRYGIPSLRDFIKETTLSDKDKPVNDPRSKYEQSRHSDE